MKKILITIPMLLGSVFCHAQWTPINSTTSEHLNDVDFLTDTYGVIVGNRETIRLTSDGGLSWTDINNGVVRGDILNVTVHNTDTIFVSSYDQSTTTGIVFVTTDGGNSWISIADSYVMNHRVDLEKNSSNGSLFATFDNLLSTDMYSSTWDTLLGGIAGITSVDLLRFTNAQVGSLSGNISGALTYSTRFFRTEDAGRTWYSGDPFSMPNADAHTTMNFVNEDTAFVFTNQYANWAPSAINRLVRINNFNLSIPSPGDTVYTFNSQIINNNMPDYMNDARFENAQNGLALGNMGKIYRTTNGGVSWSVDYADACFTCALKKMDFENGVGYAVGDAGVLVKYFLSTSVDNELSSNVNFNVYPNPNNGLFKIEVKSSDIVVGEIFNLLGERLHQLEFRESIAINLSAFPKGIYFVKITVNGAVATRKIIIE